MKNISKVYFSGSFWGHKKNERAGVPIPIGAAFSYGGYEWFLPSAYRCAKGLVLDICRKIKVKDAEAFEAKRKEEKPKTFLDNGSGCCENEDPFSFPVTFEADINGRRARCEGWCGIAWRTDRDRDEAKTEWLMEEYGLDRSCDWYFYRVRFLWPGKKREELTSLILTTGTRRVEYPCGCHFTAGPGCSPFTVEFIRPDTGSQYRLQVVSCRQEKLSKDSLPNDRGRMAFPEYYCILEYETGAEQYDPDGVLLCIKDCAGSDAPIQKESGQDVREKCGGGATAIGIIGGACGFASSCIQGEAKAERRNAYSALHFEPRQEVEWCITIQKIPFAPIEIEVMQEAER